MVSMTSSMTSRNSRTNWNPWSRTSYDVVGEASRNQKIVSLVNDDDDDDIERKIEVGSSMTRRRVPRWFSRAVLILISLLVAAVLVTISVIPMVRRETITATTTTASMMTINSTTTPTSILTDENKSCLLGEFWCDTHADVPECIPEEWRCDGELDCTTGLDEKYCEDVPPITSTTAQPLSCVAWQQTFNESCERPSSSAQCEYVPQCQADGSQWASIQCTVDRQTCWCVDQDDGRTVPGTFAGVDVLIEGEIPDCL
ncbi:uncharacterized protein LOC115919904 [Strongylocentrotus purpuratus]|uniref:Thyroglobulin type-1 domain-containing protein n=1 Tax=Strongylocentrotus purpuratus TaxID=7668 RepID=A0A7M7N5J1_STRPU|nr:uncharacterized protein LOC115919904 [Strongylocentrotus purpuratus]